MAVRGDPGGFHFGGVADGPLESGCSRIYRRGAGDAVLYCTRNSGKGE